MLIDRFCFKAVLFVFFVLTPTIAVSQDSVDLGLSVKWATRNLGADTPEDAGLYFAWGEVAAKNNYSWNTYVHCKNGANSMTKYCVDSKFGKVDSCSALLLQDDAAQTLWGKGWRCPTYEEIIELQTLCKWIWEVSGYRVIGPNGNSIFLPAVGYYDSSSVFSVGFFGCYWSSTLNADQSSYAYYLYFGQRGACTAVYDYRYLGYSIRPVIK